MISPTPLRRLWLGGIATLAATAFSLGSASAATPEYEVESVAVSVTSQQAGEHADMTIDFELTHNVNEEPYELTRDVAVEVPPGVFGNPQSLPQCTTLQFGTHPEVSECPQDSQVGVAVVTLGGKTKGTFTSPIFNMTPVGEDVVARLGLFGGPYPAIVNIKADPTDYGLIAISENISSAAGLVAVSTTLWGVPAAPAHDSFRMTALEALEGKFPPGGRKSGQPELPFLTNPTDCSAPRQVTVTATSYQQPENQRTKTAPFPAITGCGKLDFDPTFTLTPTNPEAAAPTGVDAVLQIPQDETPQGIATSTLKSAVVTLPEGLSINPAAGDGLEACSAEQVNFEKNVSAQCPDAAKIGSAEIEVPALERTLQGSVYQRTPEPGRLFGFWLVADEMGVHLKLPAEIAANPLTGQLTTLFLGLPALGGLPQVPVSEMKLHISGGPRAPLSTPAGCGTYQTRFSFTPWSGNAPVVGETPMQITSGCNKGGFDPKITAYTQSSSAGSFSPFVFQLTRADGEANPQSLALTLPQGLLAKLKGVALCPEGQTASASCPQDSKVGSLATAAGVGGAPLWIPQPGKAPTAAYLAGPYKGDPYSIVIKVPAQAGPFDLGTVVTRAAIHVDPETAVATIKSDPLPQILEGVPVSYRAIRVITDRPEFTLNPTDCSQKEVKATVTATNGATATPTAPFQATDCAKLAYAPKLKMRLKGATKRTGNPALSALLTQKPNQANTAAATVILPPSQFIDQSHINNPCTRVQFNQGACPKKSILGKAKAYTPLLAEPLQGPVYFRSNGGARELPDLVADLHGPLHVTLVGFIDSVHKKGSERSRVRTRFVNVPDAPVSRFKLDLFGGKRGLIENSTNLCKAKRRAEVRMLGQNGKRRVVRPLLGVGCR
jgi:hypothetical protein